jgi:hypothetical protein
MRQDQPQQLVVVCDFGVQLFAAQAFISPEEHRGQAVQAAGDELTYQQAEMILHRKAGMRFPTTFTVCRSSAVVDPQG